MPAFYRATFKLPDSSPPLHSWLRTDAWGHGVVFVNGFNIGRFSAWGPQGSLYVPASLLKAGPETNTIIVFESDQIRPIRRNAGDNDIGVALQSAARVAPRQMSFSDERHWM